MNNFCPIWKTWAVLKAFSYIWCWIDSCIVCLLEEYTVMFNYPPIHPCFNLQAGNFFKLKFLWYFHKSGISTLFINIFLFLSILIKLLQIKWCSCFVIVCSSTLWNFSMGRRCPDPWLILSQMPMLPKPCFWAVFRKQVSLSTWTLEPGISPFITMGATWSKCYSTALP